MPVSQVFYLRGGPKPNWIDSQFTLSLAFDDNQPNSVTFEGHQGSKSLNLLQVNVAGISGSTLDWQLVGRVLGSMKNKID